MKKTLSILASLVLCAGTMTAFTANADTICTNYGTYETWDEIIEYIDTSYTIYKGVKTKTGSYAPGYFYVIRDNEFRVNNYGAGTFHINFGQYTMRTDDEIAKLKEYITDNYPDITLNEENIFVYESELTYNEKIEIALDIKENTGLICDHYYLMDITDVIYFGVLGDINSDNAITASDAAMVLSYYAQGQTSTAPASAESEVDYSIIADYNNDGAVTAVDAALILSDYAEGQIS